MEEISDEEPTGERWDPLGAANDDEDNKSSIGKRYDCYEKSICIHSSDEYEEKLKSLEEEYELLNSSLCALTSHFAQVQFRLRQAVETPYPDKEGVLKSLEEFAFRGIPDVGLMKERIDETSVVEAIWLRRVQQQELLEKLKFQINELEQFLDRQQDMHNMLENQQIEFNEYQFPLHVELDKHKNDVKLQVEKALNQFLSPLKMKEEFVAQLKIQVADLERFIHYLQNDNFKSKTVNVIRTCRCIQHSSAKHNTFETTKNTMNIIKRLASFLHMFSLLYLGYSPQFYQKSSLNHWGDLRARLEMAITQVLEAVEISGTEKASEHQNYTSDNESFCIISNVRVTTAVRKYLAVCLRDLIQHGTCKETPLYRLVPFINCFKQTFRLSETPPLHAWEVILKYYHLKNGKHFNSSPATQLSKSFDLDITGTSGKSKKQNILFAIGNIISAHSLQKKSNDSQFKAFVCAALNKNKLVKWLSMIFRCRGLLESYYHSWSYVRKTEFLDSLHSLEVLSDIKFELPVDLEVCQTHNADEAFI